eukprot:Phypoly_transcript_18513.p1 GENE.Phypoly_transcript_18513~~Phypoly_transcript_18513.p1  ORF type:complete len:195 (+),score=35.72 Phypoly_transcript_18513:82-666(+)
MSVTNEGNSEQVVPGITVDPPGSPAQTPFAQPIPSPAPSLTASPVPSPVPSPKLPQSETAHAVDEKSPFNKDDRTGMATMAGRRHKVVLAPGHSHMDWMRKTNAEKDMAGTGGRLLRVGRTELAKHATKEDCWVAIRGKVYNVTPYLSFHPGGEPELMRGAGKDATRLFDAKHAWVNAESFLAKCLVGYFVPND